MGAQKIPGTKTIHEQKEHCREMAIPDCSKHYREEQYGIPDKDFWKNFLNRSPFTQMLGAVWPHCRPAYGCLSNRSPQGKVHGDNPSLGRDQWTSEECRILLASCSLHALFVLITFMILLVVNSFTLSVTHGTDIIIPGNLIFFSLCWNSLLFLIWK